MSRGACAFTCKWCREVARLVGEVGDLRQMMDGMKRMITGQRLEEESGETGAGRGCKGTDGICASGLSRDHIG